MPPTSWILLLCFLFLSKKKYLSAHYVIGNVLDTGNNNSRKRKTPALTEVIPYLGKTWKGWGDEPYRYLGKECFRQRGRRIPDMPERLKESQSSWNRLRIRWRRERRVHRSKDGVELGADDKGQGLAGLGFHSWVRKKPWRVLSAVISLNFQKNHFGCSLRKRLCGGKAEKGDKSGGHGPSPSKRWRWPKPSWDFEQSLHAGYILTANRICWWMRDRRRVLTTSLLQPFIHSRSTNWESTMCQVLRWVSSDSKVNGTGTSLVVQWLILCASTVGGTSSIPGWELKSCKPWGAAKKKNPEKQASLSTALKELTWCLSKGLKLLNSHVKQLDYQYLLLLLLLLLLTTTATNNYSHKTKNVLDFLHQWYFKIKFQ